ncbi:MAG: exo-alpha-sialidase [Opitutus sp.]|nr:exo-alpha-sialidase [Opitutus sp.]
MKFLLLPFFRVSILFATVAAGAAPETATVWTGGESGKAVYTIPGLLVTKSGVVIAYAEARERRGDGGKVDIAIKRSLDGGRTWSNTFFIERAQGIENYVLATLVQDRVSGRVFFFTALRDKGLADTTTTNSYRTSDDDGATWSAPHDITGLLYAADQKLQADLRAGRAPAGFAGDNPDLFGRQLVFFGPGRSIQLSPGHPRFPNRIIVPLFYIKDRVITPRAKRGYGDGVLASDDGGKTWFVPGIVPLGDYGSSEVSLAELADGRLMINARGSPPESSGMSVAGRTVSFSSDGGVTWTRPQPDTSGIPNYIETSSGLLRFSLPRTDPTCTPRLLFSFPNRIPRGDEKIGSALRANGTILLSYDEGRSWPIKKQLVSGSFGYSNMDLLPDGTVMIVYENATGTTVSATRFTLEWLTDGHDTLAQGRK